jgi:hypothetical protein
VTDEGIERSLLPQGASIDSGAYLAPSLKGTRGYVFGVKRQLTPV